MATMEGRTGQETLLARSPIGSLPQDMFYIPEFITVAEEQLLLDKINSVPSHRWTNLTHRRLQSHPSALTKTNKLLAEPLPSFLENPIIPRLQSLTLSTSSNHIFAQSPHMSPNHVLINEYRPGHGIMPHEDGDAYYPLVCTVSLNSSIVLDIYAKTGAGTREDKPGYRILQEPRSLLITRGEMYESFLHGIADVLVDDNLGDKTIANWQLLGDKDQFRTGRYERATRISLTYRDVKQVSRVGNALKFIGKR